MAVYVANDGERPVTMTDSESSDRYFFGARDHSKRESDAHEIGSESAKSIPKSSDGQSSRDGRQDTCVGDGSICTSRMREVGLLELRS